jgi:hypothetical protein
MINNAIHCQGPLIQLVKDFEDLKQWALSALD